MKIIVIFDLMDTAGLFSTDAEITAPVQNRLKIAALGIHRKCFY